MCSLLDIIDRGGYTTIQKVFLAEFWKFFQEHILWGFFLEGGKKCGAVGSQRLIYGPQI